MENVVTKEWTKANSSDTGFFEFLSPSLVLVIRHVFHFTSKMFFAMGDDLSYGLNTLGPLCLWQCLTPKSKAPQLLFFKQVSTLAGCNSAFKTPYPPLPYIF